MAPNTLRVVSFFFLVPPVAGLFTGYYRKMGAVQSCMSPAFWAFARWLESERLVARQTCKPKPKAHSNQTFRVLCVKSFSLGPCLHSFREFLFPLDPPRHLHHHKKRQDRSNRHRESRESLKEKRVRKQHQVNQLR